MPRKEVNEICVKLAGIDAKLDSIADLITRHDGHLALHDGRIRGLEKHINLAFGWAGAIGFLVSMAVTYISQKLGLK
jgi:hypothetical protein